MSDVTRVAAAQMTSGSDVEANLESASTLVSEAAARGATYVQVPEYFNYYGPTRHFAAVAETIPGPTTERLGKLARTLGVTLHLGSMLEVSTVPGHFYNTSVLLASSGEVVATYRKVHLFDVDVPGQVQYRESDAVAPGDRMVVVDRETFRLGMTVCFDLRFPELYRQLSLAGATVLAIPAAFNANTGRAHWELLVRARAIENHAFVVSAAQVGTTSEGLATWGHSMIVDPWGEVLAESGASGQDVIVADLDVAQVARRRQQIAVLSLRRPDVYVRPVVVLHDGESV